MAIMITDMFEIGWDSGERLLSRPASLLLVGIMLLMVVVVLVMWMVVATAGSIEVTVVVGVVVSHLLHVLSHPPGAIRVSHKPLANIDWHDDRGSVFTLLVQRSVVIVDVTAVLVLTGVLPLVV